jgi:hypothetical protein
MSLLLVILLENSLVVTHDSCADFYVMWPDPSEVAVFRHAILEILESTRNIHRV